MKSSLIRRLIELSQELREGEEPVVRPLPPATGIIGPFTGKDSTPLNTRKAVTIRRQDLPNLGGLTVSGDAQLRTVTGTRTQTFTFKKHPDDWIEEAIEQADELACLHDRALFAETLAAVLESNPDAAALFRELVRQRRLLLTNSSNATEA